MVHTFDLILIVGIAVVWPVTDYVVQTLISRRFPSWSPAQLRRVAWVCVLVEEWGLVGVVAGVWLAHDRAWAELDLAPANLWGTLVVAALALGLLVSTLQTIVKLRRDAAYRQSIYQQVEPFAKDILPHSGREVPWFMAVAVTAGVCEEILFRGYFVWVFTPWLGWWGAAALSVPVFGLAHFYQGRKGIVRTAIVGAFFALLVGLCESLYPAMVLHALVDITSGLVVWLVLREPREPLTPESPA